MIDAVCFDYWNTLVGENRGELRDRRLDAWGEVLAGAGLEVTREAVSAAIDHSWEHFLESWGANVPFTVEAGVGHCLDALALDPPPAVRDELVERYATAAVGAELPLAEGIGDVLRSLRGSGVKLAIVCDVGLTASPLLRDRLDRAGLLELFDAWAFSDEVGCYKPDRRMFETALTAIGRIDPGRSAHVGDLRRTDIAGARSMGMTSVRYRGLNDDDGDEGPEAHHVISHHAELLEVLHLG